MKTRTKIMAVFFVSLALCSISLADELLVPSQHSTIQAAIDAAFDGDTVIVAPGTYTGDGNRDIDFLGKAITVRSTNPNDPNIVSATIIDCNGTEAEPHRGFNFHTAEGPNSVLAGLTITNGYGPEEELYFDEYGYYRTVEVGGAIFCDNSSPTITRCTITNNSASYGGGIYCYNSSPKITNCIISGSSSGGGICCRDYSSPKIINCIISGNTTWGPGGGISCNYYSSSTIVDCVISENLGDRGGGGISCSSSNSTIINCTITGNVTHQSGGGIQLSHSNPTIISCTIASNSSGHHGGGIGCWYRDDSVPTIDNCTITSNIAGCRGGGGGGGGGGGLFNCSGPITNCTITGNTAGQDDYGGGLARCDGPITNCIITSNSAGGRGGLGGGLAECDGPITNCIIANNKTWEFGGALDGCDGPITNCTITGNRGYGYGYGSGEITNCIIWDNQPEQIYGSPTVTYSDVQGSWPGQGNIDADPYFAFSTDYHLMPTSPCIDAGDPNYVAEPNETDLDGNPRITGERIDMGAYEYNPNSPSIAVSAVSFYFTQDWPKPDPQTLLIRSCGGEPLHWEIVEDCNWLDVSPANGVYTDQISEVTITVDPNGLTPAVYTCSFEVRDPNASNNPVTVRVTMPVGEILPVPSQDFNTIQATIDAAENYDIVLVADGNYTGEGNKNLDFRGKTITVRSENGPNNCIIDCENSGRGFYFQNQETKNSVVNGFTITNAYIDGGGGGIYCYLSSPTIRNCNISANTGIGIYGELGSLKIENCNISANSGIGIYSRLGSLKIANCSVSENSGVGIFGGAGLEITSSIISGNSAEYIGGISCSGDVKITNSTIKNNSGYLCGGIYCLGRPTITNCTITGNSAHYSGGIYCSSLDSWSDPTITNCTITGNSAEDNGGGIYCWYGSPVITNCTITGNTAGVCGGGIYCKYSSPMITNSVLWGNTAGMDGDQIALNPSKLTISYSDVEGGLAAVYTCLDCSVIWGLGNIDADPCFIQPGYWADANDPNIIVEPNDPNAIWIDGDYHLLPDSPCIDAGDPNYIPEPNETDLDGNPRVNGGRIDMGAYESVMHEARLLILPRVINRKSRQPGIMAWLRLPQGITKDQIDKDVPLILYPGGIKATRQFVFQNRRRCSRRTSVFAFFNKAELMDAIETNGRVQLQVVGHLLKPGQYFYGSDTIRIIARRLPHRPPHRPHHHRR